MWAEKGGGLSGCAPAEEGRAAEEAAADSRWKCASTSVLLEAKEGARKEGVVWTDEPSEDSRVSVAPPMRGRGVAMGGAGGRRACYQRKSSVIIAAIAWGLRRVRV